MTNVAAERWLKWQTVSNNRSNETFNRIRGPHLQLSGIAPGDSLRLLKGSRVVSNCRETPLSLHLLP